MNNGPLLQTYTLQGLTKFAQVLEYSKYIILNSSWNFGQVIKSIVDNDWIIEWNNYKL